MQASLPSRSAHSFQTLPIVDVSPLFGTDSSRIEQTVDLLKRAASEVGFLYVTGHGIAPELILDLERVARAFFALPPRAEARVSHRSLEKPPWLRASRRGGVLWPNPRHERGV